MEKKIWQTRTFWTALGALVATLAAVFGWTDERYSTAIAAVFAFLTIVFVRDAQLEIGNDVKTIDAVARRVRK